MTWQTLGHRLIFIKSQPLRIQICCFISPSQLQKPLHQPMVHTYIQFLNPFRRPISLSNSPSLQKLINLQHKCQIIGLNQLSGAFLQTPCMLAQSYPYVHPLNHKSIS
ncbi:hypothetical protein ACB098_11G094800 [Castanea mollissima]